MTSSREEGDLLQTYSLGVNAYVVKPVKFPAFVEAVKQVGSFWALINEPPPGCAARQS
jgi:DNA-binding NarL/FixJ family response regulator